MTDSTDISNEEDAGPGRISELRCRKSGYSNIFSRVNLQELQRLFQTVRNKDAEHRARLIWRGEYEEYDTPHTDGAKGAVGTEEEAGLAQALVGLRICARTKAGLRAQGPTREQKWYRASPHMQIKESCSGYLAMEDDSTVQHKLSFCHEKNSENPNKSSSWKFGVVRHENAKDSERYLHGILH